MKLYVGNLSFDTSEADLRDIFEQFGTVRETRVINDRETGRSRGFAFVTMGNDAEGRAAIGTLHGKQFAGRTITSSVGIDHTNIGQICTLIGYILQDERNRPDQRLQKQIQLLDQPLFRIQTRLGGKRIVHMT